MGGAVTDQEFKTAVMQKLDNLASQIGETNIRISAVETASGGR